LLLFEKVENPRACERAFSSALLSKTSDLAVLFTLI